MERFTLDFSFEAYPPAVNKTLKCAGPLQAFVRPIGKHKIDWRYLPPFNP